MKPNDKWKLIKLSPSALQKRAKSYNDSFSKPLEGDTPCGAVCDWARQAYAGNEILTTKKYIKEYSTKIKKANLKNQITSITNEQRNEISNELVGDDQKIAYLNICAATKDLPETQKKFLSIGGQSINAIQLSNFARVLKFDDKNLSGEVNIYQGKLEFLWHIPVKDKSGKIEEFQSIAFYCVFCVLHNGSFYYKKNDSSSLQKISDSKFKQISEPLNKLSELLAENIHTDIVNPKEINLLQMTELLHQSLKKYSKDFPYEPIAYNVVHFRWQENKTEPVSIIEEHIGINTPDLIVKTDDETINGNNELISLDEKRQELLADPTFQTILQRNLPISSYGRATKELLKHKEKKQYEDKHNQVPNPFIAMLIRIITSIKRFFERKSSKKVPQKEKDIENLVNFSLFTSEKSSTQVKDSKKTKEEIMEWHKNYLMGLISKTENESTEKDDLNKNKLELAVALSANNSKEEAEHLKNYIEAYQKFLGDTESLGDEEKLQIAFELKNIRDRSMTPGFTPPTPYHFEKLPNFSLVAQRR